MLTRPDAQAIVEAVRNDPEARRRIQSWLSDALPDAAGIAGSIRNLWFMAQDFNAENPDTVQRVCGGIADQAAVAITRALGKPALGRVKGAADVGRVHRGVHHFATRVNMKDGTSYVFDWHATLNVDNPLLYPSVEQFGLGNGAVTFERFSGF